MALGISDAVELSGRVVDLVKKGVTIGLQEQVMDLREAVLNAREELLKTREENQQLRAGLKEQQSWEDRAGKYTLVQAPGGAMVYAFGGEPKHYACPACFERKQISILQDRNVSAGCFDCKAAGCGKFFDVAARKQSPTPYVSFRRGDI